MDSFYMKVKEMMVEMDKSQREAFDKVAEQSKSVADSKQYLTHREDTPQ